MSEETQGTKLRLKGKVARKAFEDAIKEAGLTFAEQSGWLKVEAAKGRRVYVQKTDPVAKVELSGFEAPVEGVIPRRGGANGACKHELLVGDDRSEEAIVSSFKAVLEHLKTLGERAEVRANPVSGQKQARPPKPKKESKPDDGVQGAAAKEGNEETYVPVGMGGPKTPEMMTANERSERLALIRKVAAEKGMTVSPKAVQDYGTPAEKEALSSTESMVDPTKELAETVASPAA